MRLLLALSKMSTSCQPSVTLENTLYIRKLYNDEVHFVFCAGQFNYYDFSVDQCLLVILITFLVADILAP